MQGISLFSSAGIAETYLKELGIDILAANELIPERADLYRALYPETNMVTGDILDEQVFAELIKSTPKTLDFLIASPPCQGMSIAGKNRNIQDMLGDKRNHLIFRVIEFIQVKSPTFVLIENVPLFLKIRLPYKNMLQTVKEILQDLFGHEYHIQAHVFDAADYGVAQRRKRAIIQMNKHFTKWGLPEKEVQTVSVQQAIGFLPSIEAGQKSNVKWHFARKHDSNHITWLKHTPTGKSAFDNIEHYPKKKNGEKIKSYNTTYHRIDWDSPAPTITIRNDAISSQLNVHPGRPLPDGTYSDARVLTPLELMLLTSLPIDWHIPDNTPELLIRRCIGECIPPLLIKKIVAQIGK
ncbi:DNA (cytosine-5-)-methyltransferase [Alysiella crassa]|uniref:DNA (cytosine-5-)-methyltransferase n=1 Tax=Alysiella crassa TaxID=153491 RepID=A0A376BSR2_9NEIS|nr:DNA cytosine methyltransferase [Alysiella crassa]UOP07915.1 DNA cytosine methyltransferase [Alysiella crassa]SSY79970.1 Modification methylase HaeIII [Alysiella crassa]